MKKTVVLLIFLMSIANLQIKAQTKGNTLLGGNISYLSSSYNSEVFGDKIEQKTSQMTISPVFGKMVTDRMAVGFKLGFKYSKIDGSNYNEPDIDQSILFAPYIRIHYNILGNFKYYMEPYFSKTFVLGDESENAPQIYQMGLNVGVLYFISQKMSLELSIAGVNYKHMYDEDTEYKSNTFSLEYDLVTPNVGLKYYF